MHKIVDKQPIKMPEIVQSHTVQFVIILKYIEQHNKFTVNNIYIFEK